MAKEHNLFLAQTSEVANEGREILDIVGERSESVAREGTGHADLKDRVPQPVGLPELPGYGPDVRDGMWTVSQAAYEDEGIPRRGPELVRTGVLRR